MKGGENMCGTVHADICGCYCHSGYGLQVFSKRKKIEMLEKYLDCLDEKKKGIQEAIKEIKEQE
jgi:hypothetical protein